MNFVEEIQGYNSATLFMKKKCLLVAENRPDSRVSTEGRHSSPFRDTNQISWLEWNKQKNKKNKTWTLLKKLRSTFCPLHLFDYNHVASAFATLTPSTPRAPVRPPARPPSTVNGAPSAGKNRENTNAITQKPHAAPQWPHHHHYYYHHHYHHHQLLLLLLLFFFLQKNI